MKNIRIKFAAVALVLCAAMPAYAGVGGSAEKIRSAVASGSVDAIVAEVERAEGLACDACVQIVTNLTEDSRYQVREVAAWWFAKRPALKDMLNASTRCPRCERTSRRATGCACAMANVAHASGISSTSEPL